MGNNRKDWWWLDDLNYLLLHTIMPLVLMTAGVFGGMIGLSAEERAGAVSIAGFLVREGREKSKKEEEDK